MNKLKRFIKTKFKKIFSNSNTEEIRKLSESNYKNLKWILECQRTNQFKVIEVELVQKRPFYDSTWMIYFMNDGKLSNLKLVTSPFSKNLLTEKLINVQSVEEILALDEKNTIYYD